MRKAGGSGMLAGKEKAMPAIETMTIGEKLDISIRSIALKKAGDTEGADRLLKTAPLPSYIAKIIKERVGADYLVNSGWNLSEAEAEFGSDWLSR